MLIFLCIENILNSYPKHCAMKLYLYDPLLQAIKLHSNIVNASISNSIKYFFIFDEVIFEDYFLV